VIFNLQRFPRCSHSPTSALCRLLSILCLLISVLCPLSSALCPLPFTFHLSPFTFNLQPFTYNLLPFTFNLSPLTNNPELETRNMLLSLTRYSLYSLLIFTPLAIGSVQGWAINVIHFVTLIGLTTFLFEKSLTWDWKWIRTPLDKPILCLLVLCLLSSVFSVHTYTSIWSSVLLLNYLIIFYLAIHVVRTRSQFRQLVYLIVFMAALVSIIGLLKKFYGNPFLWWDYTDFQNTPDRLSSTFGNADHLAGYMEMTIPLLLGLLLTGLRGIKLYFIIVTIKGK